MKLNVVNRLYAIIILFVLMIATQNSLSFAQDLGGFSYPAWSPDGAYIAFASIKSGTYQILLLKEEDRTIRNLSGEAKEGTIEDIRWSPDGNYLAYTVFRRSKVDIWVIPVFEGQPHNMTLNMKGNSRTLAWSQDGTKIAFTNDYSETDNYLSSQLWVVDIDTMATTQLTSDNGCYVDPQWLQNDNLIMLTSLDCLGHKEGLYHYDFSTNEVAPMTYGRVLTYAISPSEEYVAAASLKPSSYFFTDLILLGDGTLVNLTPDTTLGLIFHLSWSSDGKQLVLSTGCNRGIRIIRVNVENHELFDITSCADGEFSNLPSWSPDGSSIIYMSDHSDIGGRTDIWLYDLATEKHINLTKDL